MNYVNRNTPSPQKAKNHRILRKLWIFNEVMNWSKDNLRVWLIGRMWLIQREIDKGKQSGWCEATHRLASNAVTGILLGPATAARSERLSVEGRLTLGLPLVLVESDDPWRKSGSVHTGAKFLGYGGGLALLFIPWECSGCREGCFPSSGLASCLIVVITARALWSLDEAAWSFASELCAQRETGCAFCVEKL